MLRSWTQTKFAWLCLKKRWSRWSCIYLAFASLFLTSFLHFGDLVSVFLMCFFVLNSPFIFGVFFFLVLVNYETITFVLRSISWG
jgi:hypothetical protein